MSIEKFSYYDDVCLEIGGKTYTIGDLIYMNDKNFNSCYENYEVDIKVRLGENTLNKHQNFSMLAISHTISLMEKIRLERRIIKLENIYSKN